MWMDIVVFLKGCIKFTPPAVVPTRNIIVSQSTHMVSSTSHRRPRRRRRRRGS